MNIRTRLAGPLGIVALTLGAAIAPAQAQQTINMTAIDGYPSRALWVKEFINFYIPEVDTRLAKDGKYKIRWNQAWGGQIVKPRGVLEGIQKGLGDIGIACPETVEMELHDNVLRSFRRGHLRRFDLRRARIERPWVTRSALIDKYTDDQYTVKITETGMGR